MPRGANVARQLGRSIEDRSRGQRRSCNTKSNRSNHLRGIHFVPGESIERILTALEKSLYIRSSSPRARHTLSCALCLRYERYSRETRLLSTSCQIWKILEGRKTVLSELYCNVSDDDVMYALPVWRWNNERVRLTPKHFSLGEGFPSCTS